VIDIFKYLALFEAVKNINYIVIKYLISDHNLDINYDDAKVATNDFYDDDYYDYYNYYHNNYDNIEMVKFLIEQMGAIPNLKVKLYVILGLEDMNFNALQYAFAMGSKQIVKYLMDNYDISHSLKNNEGNNIIL